VRRSRSNQHDKVERARAIADQALGDRARRDGPRGTPKYVPVTKPPDPVPVRDEPVGVLTIGEVATRLGRSRAEVERMIAYGQVETLPIEFGRVIPTSEVERLRRAGS
jgi:hypothetical protein